MALEASIGPTISTFTPLLDLTIRRTLSKKKGIEKAGAFKIWTKTVNNASTQEKIKFKTSKISEVEDLK